MDNPINVIADLGTTAYEPASCTVSAEYFVTTEAAVLVLVLSYYACFNWKMWKFSVGSHTNWD